LRASICRHGIIKVRITPPIPASKRVHRRREIGKRVTYRGLRVEDDQAIGVGPLVVTGVFDVAVSDRVKVLHAAV
jgi:hypothetical protein